MQAETTQEAGAIRYGIYTLAAVTVALLIGFLYLFNFTTFFKLAPL